MGLRVRFYHQLSRGFFASMICLLVFPSLNAQRHEVQFDDSDMATSLSEALTYQKYPTYDQYVQMMQQFDSIYPEICQLDTFGNSVEGRLLLALKISDHVAEDEPEARFLYTSSMHGNEVVGFVLALRLADTLLKGYGKDSEITRLVDSLAIWINPLANPDGSFSADHNTSLKNARRSNIEGIDLNRDFPDPGKPEPDDPSGRALENQWMMQFLKTHRFTLSANIHSGTEVVNYPWDHKAELHADDDWYRFISREYADEAMAVDPGYMFGWPDQGITNGWAWYEALGTRQDYVNWYLEGREVTLELSESYLLGSEFLEEYWAINYRSLLNYMAQCTYGIRGRVRDQETGQPVRAMVYIPGHDSAYSVARSRNAHGDFYRLIREGVFDLVISAPGYLNDTVRGVEVTDYSATFLDIRLAKDPRAGVPIDPDAPGLKLYPNPSGGLLFIDPGQGWTGSLVIRIFNPTGQLQVNRSVGFTGQPIRLQLDNLPGGLYILHLTSHEFSGSQLFMKQ